MRRTFIPGLSGASALVAAITGLQRRDARIAAEQPPAVLSWSVDQNPDSWGRGTNRTEIKARRRANVKRMQIQRRRR